MGFNKTQLFDIDITPDINAYASGDVLGDFSAIGPFATSGKTLMSVLVIDPRTAGALPVDVYFFPATFSVTDNDPFAPTDAQALEELGHISIETADYKTNSVNSSACKTGVGLALYRNLNADDDLFVVLVARGSATFGAAATFRVRLTFWCDGMYE